MVIMWAYVICNFLVFIKDDSLKQKLQHYCRVYKVYWHNTHDNTEDKGELEMYYWTKYSV